MRELLEREINEDSFSATNFREEATKPIRKIQHALGERDNDNLRVKTVGSSKLEAGAEFTSNRSEEAGRGGPVA